MYPSYLEYFRERNSISLVDFDYDRNLFEFEQNSALPVLKGRLLFSYSDASSVACGAFVVGTNEVSHRMWTACEAVKSSTWRELKAIQFAL